MPLLDPNGNANGSSDTCRRIGGIKHSGSFLAFDTLEQNAKVQAAGAIHQQNDADNDHHQKSRGELAKLRDASPALFAAVAGDFKL
jgi:hypothetical protein